jgi:molecular chaperone DnaJ
MTAPTKDPWVLLGVDRGATDSEIKRAYRRLAKRYHPDRNSGDEEAAALFQEIARAFEAIQTGEARDAWLAENEGAGSIFEPLDSDGAGPDPFTSPSANLRSEVRPVEHRLSVTFAQAFSGAQFPIELDIEDACGTCGGSGSAPGYRPLTCQVCHGRGVHSAGRVRSKCAACSGKGFIVERPCVRCDGGLIRQRRSVRIDIPAGVTNGHVVRIAGNHSRAGTPDVLVHVQVEESPIFRRSHQNPADLMIEVPITYAEACLGKSIKIPTPEKPIVLRLPPGSPSGKALRIANQGMPVMGRNGERGHLYAKLQVDIPTKMSNQQHRLITQLSHYDDPERMRIHLFNGGRRAE